MWSEVIKNVHYPSISAEYGIIIIIIIIIIIDLNVSLYIFTHKHTWCDVIYLYFNIFFVLCGVFYLFCLSYLFDYSHLVQVLIWLFYFCLFFKYLADLHCYDVYFTSCCIACKIQIKLILTQWPLKNLYCKEENRNTKKQKRTCLTFFLTRTLPTRLISRKNTTEAFRHSCSPQKAKLSQSSTCTIFFK